MVPDGGHPIDKGDPAVNEVNEVNLVLSPWRFQDWFKEPFPNHLPLAIRNPAIRSALCFFGNRRYSLIV